MTRKAAGIVLSCVVAAALCGVPQGVFAQNAAERQKEMKKDKKEQKKEKSATEQKQTKADDKAKKESDPRAGVNRIYDNFKKSTEPAKKESGSLRKSINDAWDKLKGSSPN